MLSTPSRRYAPWLWILLWVFVFRVVAQPLSLVAGPRILPPFEAWHSGVVPYALLLAMQLVILVWFGWIAWQFTTGSVTPQRGLGMFALATGTVYLGVMMIRLMLGMTVLSHHPWFNAHLPTTFHLGLATFILLVGRFHYAHAN